MQNTPKTIVHLIRQGKIGGGESHVLSLVAALDPKEFRSVVISFTDGPMIKALDDLKIKCYVVHTTIPFNALINKRVTEIIRSEKADVIHAHGTRAASNVYRSAAALKIPMVYTVHGWSFHKDQNKLLFRARNRAEQYLVSKADHTICVSKANLDEGKSYFDMPHSSFIHNSVDFTRFNPEVDFRAEIRNECGIPADSYCIGYIVRMTLQKDPLNMVRAAAIAARKDPNLHFLMAGDGEFLEPAKSLADTLGVSNRISFPGFRTDVPEILSACDAYVLSSLWEGLPIGIIEAMAMKKPSVVSNIAANAELIEDGKQGFLVPMQNDEALAEGILKLSLNNELSDRMGESAYEKARRMFNITLLAEKVGNVYFNLLGLPVSSNPMPDEPGQSSVK